MKRGGDSDQPPRSSRASIMTQIATVEEHRVKTGETLEGLARAAGLTWQQLAQFNWGIADPDKVNERLRNEVGCTRKTRDGRNYVFDDSDHPGIVFIPRPWERTGLVTDATHVIRVRRRSRFFVILTNDDGLRIPYARYEATLADGRRHSGRLGRGGVDAIENPPEGTVEVSFPDVDDVEAKSIAATVRKALDHRDAREVHRLFRYPADTIRRVFEAYDRYFNDYRGQGLRHDLEQEWSSDNDAQMLLFGYLQGAGIIGSQSELLDQKAGPDG